MRNRIVTGLCALLVACAADTGMAQTQVSAPVAKPKYTAATFARLPFVQRPRLSPDGNRIAGLVGLQGRQIIAVLGLFDGEMPVRVGVPDGTQATWIRWVNDENILVGLEALLPIDTERWYISRAIAISLKSGKVTRLLWDLNGQNGSRILWTPSDGSNEILMAAQASIYMGEGFWPSVYRVDVLTGHRTRVTAGQSSVHSWYADDAGRVRVGFAASDGGLNYRLLYRGENASMFRTIDSAKSRQRESLIAPFLFLPGTDHALAVHDDKDGRSGIYEVDLLTRADIRTVFAPPPGRGEVDDPILSDDGKTLLGVTLTDAQGSIQWIDPALAGLQAQFDKALNGRHARIVSFNRDRTRMLVSVGTADTPGMLYYYDTAGGTLKRIAFTNEEIGGAHLAPVRLVHYRSRDGLEIEGVLTEPVGASGKHAFIVMPHGGPWAHDDLSYDYIAQFLASRGYTVLQPNFRGSTGYGSEFVRRGEGQMGLAMQDDLTDGVKWAVAQGIADPKRVCIVGGSYGGYAAMWGIAHDPDLYRCAISIAGVSSLRREVNDFSNELFATKYRDDWQRMTPDFAAVSPVNAIDRIHTPLLLIHGKKDVTVDVSQSSRMFAAMQKAGKTVDYVPLPLADHYFTREEDRLTLLTSMGDFLEKYNPAGDAATSGGGS